MTIYSTNTTPIDNGGKILEVRVLTNANVADAPKAPRYVGTPYEWAMATANAVWVEKNTQLAYLVAGQVYPTEQAAFAAAYATA